MKDRSLTKVACLEEIAWRKGWLSTEKLHEKALQMENTEYGTYLKELLDEQLDSRSI